MSLLIKPPSWGHCSTNLTGTPSTSVWGTSVTAGANDTDGTAAALLTALTHDVEYLVVGINGYSGTNINSSVLVDILIDPAGGSSWATAPLINDLLGGECFSASLSLPIPVWYHFPIWLPSGCSIGAQARTANGADNSNGEVIVYAYGGNANPSSWWCGQSVETIGVDDTISQGQNHTPGASGSYSTWANLGSALSKASGAVQFAVHGTNTDTIQQPLAYLFEFGVAGTRIGPPIFRSTNNTETGWMLQPGPMFYAAPAGTQFQVRATCSGTSETLDAAAYAVM